MNTTFTTMLTAACAAGLLVAAAGTSTVSAQDGLASAKGIYREGQKPGVKFQVLLNEGTRDRRVPVTHDFVSGDRFKFQLESNKDGYVYILNRTLPGDPEQLSSKGITRIVEDDRRNPSTRTRYTLLWPNTAQAQRIRANTPFTVPAEFRMDNEPGVEKLYVVVAEKPIRIEDYFDVRNGQQRATPTAGSGTPRRDTNEDLWAQLGKDLTSWVANADASMASKGIQEVESYGIVRDGAKPAAVEISLKHFGK